MDRGWGRASAVKFLLFFGWWVGGEEGWLVVSLVGFKFAVVEESPVEGVAQRLQCGLSPCGFEFAFPDGDGSPSHECQFVAYFVVSLLVTLDLVHPKLGVGLWHSVILASFMSMPETSVDEDASAVLAQDDVGLTRQPLVVEAVSEAMMP